MAFQSTTCAVGARIAGDATYTGIGIARNAGSCKARIDRGSIGGMLIRNGKYRDEFYTGERVWVTELLNDAAAPEVSLARCRVLPGVATELHRLSVAEWYVIESGSGMMEVGGRAEFAVGPGDVVAIPQGTSQRISNTGDADLVLQCVCVPRFTPGCYEALE